jgi:beta-carotene 3-hydroxylase
VGNGMLILGVFATVTTLAMEGWAICLHGLLWHGPWWGTHRSHHPTAQQRSAKRGLLRGFEANDIFAVIHGGVSTVLIMTGCKAWYSLWGPAVAGIGTGMAVYGTAYAMVHDGFIHGRLPMRFLGRWRWVRRIAAAHRVHHHVGEAPYGLFSGPSYLRRQKVRRRARQMHNTRLSS